MVSQNSREDLTHEGKGKAVLGTPGFGPFDPWSVAVNTAWQGSFHSPCLPLHGASGSWGAVCLDALVTGLPRAGFLWLGPRVTVPAPLSCRKAPCHHCAGPLKGRCVAVTDALKGLSLAPSRKLLTYYGNKPTEAISEIFNGGPESSGARGHAVMLVFFLCPARLRSRAQ